MVINIGCNIGIGIGLGLSGCQVFEFGNDDVVGKFGGFWIVVVDGGVGVGNQ